MPRLIVVLGVVFIVALTVFGLIAIFSGVANPLVARLPKIPYREFELFGMKGSIGNQQVPIQAKCQPPANPGVTVVSPGVRLGWDEATCQYLASFEPTPVPPAPVVPAKAVPTMAPTKAPTAKANSVPPKTNGVTVNVASLTAQSTQQQGSWVIEYFDGATAQMRGWKFADLVKDWDKYPNVDMPKYQFLAKDGVEYGTAESAYCQRAKTCDINVPAMHYRLVTGDYNIPGIDDCVIDKAGAGCGIMLINVGTVSAMFRESSVDYGFTVEGRYWNGDTMPTTVRALLSSTAYNMMVANTVNPGANCSIPTGCQKLRMTFAIMSGNQLLVKGTQVVSR